MFWKMTIIEEQKLFKRAIFWVELGLTALAIVILYTLLYVTTQFAGATTVPAGAADQIQQSLIWPGALKGAIEFAAGPALGGLMMIILVGAVTAQEYSWRTFQLWLSHGVSRPTLLAAKFAALLPAAALLVLTTLLAGGVVSAVISWRLVGAIPFGEVDWALLAGTAVRVAYTLLPYAALTFFLAILSRSTVVAVGGGLAFALLLEGIVVQLFSFAGGAWARIGQYLPSGLSRSLLATSGGVTVEIGDQTASMDLFLAPETAVIGIAIYTAVFLALSILLFQRQDLGG